MARPVVAQRSVKVRASPARLWPLLIDTDRLNRRLGLAPVSYRRMDGGTRTAARLIGRTIAGGFPAVYEELPFEWTFQRRFSVRRNYLSGPLHWFSLTFLLEPEGEDTTVSVRVEAEGRWPLRPLVVFNLRQVAAGFATLVEELASFVASAGPDPFASPRSGLDQAALERAVDRLRAAGVDAPVAEQLRRLVQEASDADCAKIRPLELAGTWNRPTREVLGAFLAAVPAGVLELRWALICPSCVTTAEEVSSLAEIPAAGHCNLCDLSFDLDLDRAVEAFFRPSPGVRRIPEQQFCLAGPGRTPHVLSQAITPVGTPTEVAAPADPGRYRLFARGGARATVEVLPRAAARVEVTVEGERLVPAEVEVAPGGAVLVTNATDAPRHVKLERLTYATAALTAFELSTLSEFRRLFSAELVKRGTPLKVARAAILFTDLTGSTALYTRVGDAAAFRLVDDHFDVLRAAIDGAGGTVVKTMGDAVMASFHDEDHAVAGAVACLHAFAEFRSRIPHGALTHLKLGLYGGPVYVITANGILDYFGQTVNVASRLQHLAESGEIIVEASLWERLATGPARLARESSSLVGSAPFAAQVKGVDQPLQLVRVRLAEPARGAASRDTVHAGTA